MLYLTDSNITKEGFKYVYESNLHDVRFVSNGNNKQGTLSHEEIEIFNKNFRKT